ncbi:GH3 auxin-responsive promoter family protein [Eubacteriaceae bacterium ES3]|nr:GH3 auxin-responsive promoter family protein [Eubacteriaceae bacterium ES3]
MRKFITKQVYGLKIRHGKKKRNRFDELVEEAGEKNKELLMNLIRSNESTEYGEKYDFKNIQSLKDYREKVPFSTYDDYYSYIERMVNHGEANLLTSEPIVHYALTSGSVDNPKKIPVSQKTVDLYQQYASEFSFSVINDALKGSWNRHRGLNLMEIKFENLPGGLFAGSISGRAIYTLKNFLPLMFTSPNEIVFPQEIMDAKYVHLRFALLEEDLSFMGSAFMTALSDLMKYLEANWELLVSDIEKGIIDPQIKISDTVRNQLLKKIKPEPSRAKALRKIFSQGFDSPIIPRIWPNLSFIFAIGSGGFAVYTDKMRDYLGNIPIYFSVYAASESIMAICTEMESQEFTLIPDSAFYEFIPVGEDADPLKTLTLDELEVGKDYEIVLTNTSGFYRYRIKDVIRVVGWNKKSPKIQFVYRLNQMVSIAGEKTTEECISWAVTEFSKDVGCALVDFSVFANINVSPGRYTIVLETEKPIPFAKREEAQAVMEEKLNIANPSIAKKIKAGVLSHTELAIVQEETYALYRDLMIMRGISGNQLKPVRVIDTLIKEKFFFALLDKEL